MKINKPNKIIVHHSASSNKTTSKQISKWHQDRSFYYNEAFDNYIGYHYLIFPNGKIEQTKLLKDEGCHCFPSSTEVLTPKGWKYIKNIKKTDLIANVSNNLTMDFSYPVEIIKSKTRTLYTMKNKNIDIEATSEHEFLVKNIRSSKYTKQKFVDFFKTNNKIFPCSVNYSNTTEIIDDNFLQLCIAIICDGSLIKRNNNLGFKGCEFHFSKKRKILKIKQLIKNNNLKLSEYKRGDGVTDIRIYNTIFIDKFISLFPNKELDWWLLNIDKNQRTNILEYYNSWGGHKSDKYDYLTISSISKKNIDILQAIAAISGTTRGQYTVRHPNINSSSYENGKDIYTLSIAKRNSVQVNKKSYGEKIFTSNQNVYCITSKNHNLLVRNNGKVLVVGNCIGQNTSSIGICVIGNFENTWPTNQQAESLMTLIDYLNKTIGTMLPVYGHCDFSNTLCPGKTLQSFVKLLNNKDIMKLIYK